MVFELVQSGGLKPPGGFILGGLGHTLGVTQDPELWLTQALGFDPDSIGATATPIWAGSTLDFGSTAIIVALAVGVLLGVWSQRMPALSPWFSFGIVLSSYGSYLVSVQFLTATIALTVVLWLGTQRIMEQR